MKKFLFLFLVNSYFCFSAFTQSVTDLQKTNSTSIVFIHGMFFTGECWKDWMNYFEAQGYKCYTPSWPFHQKPINELQQSPDKKLGHLNITDITGYYEKFIDSLALPEKPILVGHSIGGLVVQQLLERKRGAAGILVSSAPPKWTLSFKPKFYKSNLPILYPLAVYKPYKPSFHHFSYALANTVRANEQHKIYDQLLVPETRIVEWNLFGNRSKIHFHKVDQPLLFITGKEDRIIPSSLVQKNFKKYQKTNSLAEYKEFPNRSHLILLEQNWQEVADYVNDWLDIHTKNRIVKSE